MTTEPADSRDELIGRILNEYLDRARRGEPVREEELLSAHPEVADELRAHFGMVRHVSPLSSHGGSGDGPMGIPAPDALPGYEILCELHRGAQGVVYQALQKSTQRKVAIKVMREGPFAGWRDRTRFEREVQVLAAMKHPSIVTIHDSGTASGCHFFVMDFVDGMPLDAWLSDGPRPIERTLRLFAGICEAVNEAHLKGIIHRDLKPGNIRIDDQDQPHILDFGLAKVTADEKENAREAHMTVIGQFVGSLPWTSPEQAQGLHDQVDTRTDVYALGVILYQLLTNTFPYDVAGPMRDVLNRIAGGQLVRPTAIRKEIDRDVEAIVLKCLRTEPHRRYQTAGEVGHDIQRYLNGRPVAARSDSGLYILGKTLRRHRTAVAVALAFAALVGVSLLASLSLWRQAVSQRDRAIETQRQLDRQRARADAKAAEAEQARQVAERERARAQEQAEQLRRTAYLNRIALARNACDQKYFVQTRQLLDACPGDLRGWEWYHLARLTRQSPLMDIVADSEAVTSIALSSDGRRIVTGGYEGVIRVWDAASGARISQHQGHTGQTEALAVSPDDRWIASCGRDKTLRIWDAGAGSQRILQADEGYVNSAAFSPDGTVLVTGGQSRVLTFWDVVAGRLLRKSAPHDKEISRVAYSPDGKQVASGELLNPSVGGCRLRVWDAATGQLVRELAGPPGAILSVAFSPDGKLLACGGGVSPASKDAQGTLKLFDTATGKELFSLRGHEGFVEALAFSPDGTRLASAGIPRSPAFGMESDWTLKTWDPVAGTELCTYSAHNRGGRAVAWSRDGRRVFSGGMDGRLKAWPATAPPEARILRGMGGSVLQIAVSPDGKQLASTSELNTTTSPPAETPDSAIQLWDLATGSQTRVLNEPGNTVLGLAWSPDGKRIASCGTDRMIRVWDCYRGTRHLQLPAQEAAVRSVAFSPDGSRLAAAAGQTVTLWKIPQAALERRLSRNDTPLMVTFSADGRWIATSTTGGDVRIWDAASGNVSRSIPTGPGLNGAWFGPDSRMIASAHANGVIVLWDARTGERVASMYGPQRSIEWLDFSPDGQRIASGTADMMLKVWDVPSTSEVYSVRAHDAAVTCARFSPDGMAIVTSGQDGLIKIWDGQAEPATQPTSTKAGG